MHSDIVDYHQRQTDSVREICEALAVEIEKSLKKSENKVWHAHPVWFLDGNPVVGYDKLKANVRLMFWSGQSFETPGLSKTGTFKAAEIRYDTAADIDVILLRKWLKESRDVQWDYKNIVRRKGILERVK